MSNWTINRRRFLAGSGAAFLLPLFEQFAPRAKASATGADPKRFVSLYMPSGTYNLKGDAVWYPSTGALSAGTLPLVLSPFAANLADFSILKHVGMSARNLAGQNHPAGHVSAVTTWLTSSVYTDPWNANHCTVPGPSVDQAIATAAGKPALVTHAGCHGNDPDSTPFDYGNYVSYNNGKAIEPNKNPVDLYKGLFGSLVTPPPATAIPKNHSVLDSALNDLKDLKSRLGVSDNLKLDDYLTGLRAIETKYFSAPGTPPLAQCSPGAAPAASLNNVDNDGRFQDYVARVQAFFDVFVLAFKCDVTRSVSFMFDGDTSERTLNLQVPPGLNYGNVALNGGNHSGVSHFSSNAMGREKCISRDRLYVSLMMYLVNGLKAATDPSGSRILDNTLIFGGYAVDDGSHGAGGPSEGAPIILAGGRNLIHPGFSYEASFDLRDLHFTMANKMGLGINSFAGSSTLVGV